MKPTPDAAEIVTQLRCASRVRDENYIPLHLSPADCKLAADEIERLQAENESLRRWKALDKPITAAMEIANSHIAQMRAEVAAEARRYASHYPEASDGRNTFILLAEWVERRGGEQSAEKEGK